MARALVSRMLARLATLEDPVRRDLYLFVVAHGRDTSRDQAARGVGVSRALAAFHLDKLVEHGLLDVAYRRLTRKRGPGAGRPAKLYRRSSTQLTLSLPPREYELAARLFADALATGKSVRSLHRVATGLGRRLGAESRRPGKPSRSAAHRALVAALSSHGYEPSTSADGTVVLHNCPFDALAQTHRALMCSTNRALLEGVRRGVGLTGYEVVASSEPGRCCAKVRPR